MQTHFSSGQLADPATRQSEGVIRRCVHCGFCTATCPTYVLLGNELDSPRGRISLIKEMLERGEQPSREVVKHIDRCLSCLACETTCPSGVSYRRLVDHARSYIEEHYRRPLAERMLRWMLAHILPYRRRFAVASYLGRMLRPLAPLFERPAALRPLAAMLRLALPLQSFSAVSESSKVSVRHRVAMLGGCVEPVMGAHVQAAARRLLERMGCEVLVIPATGCCGAMPQHLGREKQARAFARRNVDACSRAIADGVDTIVVTASGCGSFLKDYGNVFGNDPRYDVAAQRVAARVRDVTELIAELGLPDVMLGDAPAIAYHSACSLQHGQRVGDMPQRLLEQAGFSVSLPREAHLCCGSAGTYNILQPDIAEKLGRRKASALDASRPVAVASGNIGCMAQIASYARTPIVHTVELLDWATGGPVPPALGRAAKR